MTDPQSKVPCENCGEPATGTITDPDGVQFRSCSECPDSSDEGETWTFKLDLPVRIDLESIRIAILTRTSTGFNDPSYTACKPLSGEILRSASHNDTQGVLVFERKYGNPAGLRTVVLMAPDKDAPLTMVANAVSVPAVENVKKQERIVTAQRTNILEMPAPIWWRVLDSENAVIADNLTNEMWASRIATSLAEFGARLVRMQGRVPVLNVDKVDVNGREHDALGMKLLSASAHPSPVEHVPAHQSPVPAHPLNVEHVPAHPSPVPVRAAGYVDYQHQVWVTA